MSASDQTITDTDFRHHGASRLMRYIARGDHSLKNRAGQQMDQADRDRFQAKSQHHQFERHIILSPGDDQLDQDALEHATRDTINQMFDGETVDFAYSVHDGSESGDRQHAHVVLTGDVDDLYMDKGDCDRLREIAHERCQERSRSVSQQLLEENDLSREHTREHQRGTR